MYYLNNYLVDLERISYDNKRYEYLRLDLNENPGGLPQEFIDETLKAVTPEFLSEYPEMSEFTHVLTNYLGIDESNLCLVNGSAEGIRHIIEAFTVEGGKIVGVIPSYAMFKVYADMYGREFIPVSYTENLEMPISNILEKMTPDVQLLILVNPNNPMGNTYTEREFEQILQLAKEMQITILIDEAYHYFYPKTFMRYALENEHIFITRTFSKLFSLAGARLGYVVGWQAGIAVIQKLLTPHNVNAFAQLFAQRILENPCMIEELVSKHKQGRQYFEDTLAQHGYEYQGEHGNYIFIKQKSSDPERLVQRMKDEKKILIKTYSGIGKFGTCLRVTTAEKQYMEVFLSALFELDK